MLLIQNKIWIQCQVSDGFYAVWKVNENLCYRMWRCQTYRLLKVGDEVVTILVLLETSERHLSTGDVLEEEHELQCHGGALCSTVQEDATYLLGVLEVIEQSLLFPYNSLVHVGSGVGEALSLTGLAAKDTKDQNAS